MKCVVLIVGIMLFNGLWQSPACGASRGYDVRNFGAVPDGETMSTVAIQAAVDACAAAGGGTVRLEGGRFLSGTVYLRSHVTLEVAAGATLLGSTNLADYPENIPALRSYTDNYVNRSLIAGEDLDDIGLVGHGLIDGQGSKFQWAQAIMPYKKDRPYVIRLVNCRGVRVEGLRLRDSAMWMQHYLGCERVLIRGIHVWNFHNQCNDSLDLDGCKDCSVLGCIFESDDDGITLKSSFARPCENVVVSNCIARSHANAIKLGTETTGGFKNITISNCVITSPSADLKVVSGRAGGLGGVTLEIVDGGTLENVTVSNVVIDGVTSPLFLRLGNRGRPIAEGMPKPAVGAFRNVVISNIVATRASRVGCSITGISGHPIENVQLSNIQITFEGGGTRDEAAPAVPEKEDGYPECTMFRMNLPAYGLYCAHVTGLRLRDVQLRTEQPDLRHAIVGKDIERLVIDGLDVRSVPGAAPPVRLIDCPAATVRNSTGIAVETDDAK